MEEMRKSGYMNYNLDNLHRVTVTDRNKMFSTINKGKNATGGNWGGKESFYNGQ